MCFSMYRNLKRLVSTDADEHHLKSMHGIKLYSMACVMLGHRLMFSLGSPIHNPEFIEGASTHRMQNYTCACVFCCKSRSREARTDLRKFALLENSACDAILDEFLPGVSFQIESGEMSSVFISTESTMCKIIDSK